MADPAATEGSGENQRLNAVAPDPVGGAYQSPMISADAVNAAVQESSGFLAPLFSEINKCVVGQRYLVERLVIGLLANGHVLL